MGNPGFIGKQRISWSVEKWLIKRKRKKDMASKCHTDQTNRCRMLPE